MMGRCQGWHLLASIHQSCSAWLRCFIPEDLSVPAGLSPSTSFPPMLSSFVPCSCCCCMFQSTLPSKCQPWHLPIILLHLDTNPCTLHNVLPHKYHSDV